MGLLLSEKHNQWPFLGSLGTNHPCMKGIKIYSNEGPRPFQMGDNCEIAKMP